MAKKIASASLRLFFIALQSCKGPGRRIGRAAEATAAGRCFSGLRAAAAGRRTESAESAESLSKMKNRLDQRPRRAAGAGTARKRRWRAGAKESEDRLAAAAGRRRAAQNKV